MNFHDARLPRDPQLRTDAGGSVETFSNTAYARRPYQSIQGFAKNPLFAECDYLNGIVLLRVPSTLAPAQAGAYKRAQLRSPSV